jgi:hypothetical protein
MRDFKAGGDINVNGNVVIHDESTQVGKFLINCTNDELIEERSHRTSVLWGERKRKLSRLVMVWVFLGLMLTGVAVYLYSIGRSEFSSLVLGGGSIAIGLGSIKLFVEPNEFELRQHAALKEIAYILRERGRH